MKTSYDDWRLKEDKKLQELCGKKIKVDNDIRTGYYSQIAYHLCQEIEKLNKKIAELTFPK